MERLKKKLGLCIAFVYFCVCVTSFVLALDYEVVSAKHDLIDHELRLRVTNDNIYAIEYEPKIDLNTFRLLDAEMFVVNHVSYDVPLYDTEYSCSLLKNGTEFCNYNSVVIGSERRTREELLPFQTDTQKTDTLFAVRTPSKLAMNSAKSNELVIRWSTPAESFGSTGGWSINPNDFWNISWDYRLNFTVNNFYDNALGDYACNQTLDLATPISEGKLNATGSDLRIVDPEFNLSISWVNDTALNSATAVISFRCNVSASTNKTFSVYYGNDGVPTTRTNQTSIKNFNQLPETTVLILADAGTGALFDHASEGHMSCNSPVWIQNSTCLYDDVCFDMDENYCTLPNADNVNIHVDYTIEFWVYSRDKDAWQDPIGKRDAGADACRIPYHVRFDDSGNFEFNHYDGSTYFNKEKAYAFTENDWHYYAIVRDRSGAGKTYWYVDGNEIGQENDVANLCSNNGVTFNLGTFDSSVATGENDLVYQGVRLTNRSLSGDEINHSALNFNLKDNLVGSEEPRVVIVAVGDLLFLNESGISVTTFSEGEEFDTRVNVTLSGVSINDSVCTVTFPQGVQETEASNQNFTLCNSGCDFDTFTFTLTGLDNSGVFEDFLRFRLCHEQIVGQDLDYNGTCGATTFSGTIAKGNFPLCNSAQPQFLINTSECIAEANVEIDFNNVAPNSQRHQISGLIYDREYINHEETATFNSSTSLYHVAHDHKYYVHGTKNINAYCNNTDPSDIINVTETITIENAFPEIFHTLVELDGIGFAFTNGSSYNVSNSTVIEFFIGIVDDDFQIANHTIFASDGTVLLNISEDNINFSWSLLGADFPADSYNFTTIANDTVGNVSDRTTLFTITKYFELPVIVQHNITPAEVFTNTDTMNCSATATDVNFDNLNVTFEWFREGVAQPTFDTTVATTNNTEVFSDKPVNATFLEGEVWNCTVRFNNGQVWSSTSNVGVGIQGAPLVQPSLSLDLSQTVNVLLLGLFVILWLSLVMIGHMFGNFVFSAVGFIIGMLVGFFFVQIHPIFTVIIVLLNAFSLFALGLRGR